MSTPDYLSDVIREAELDKQPRESFAVESFADWLYGECMEQHPVDLPPLFRRDMTAEDFGRKNVPSILAFASDQGQRPINRLAALDALFCRFEKQQAADQRRPTVIEQVEAQLRSVVAPASILLQPRGV